MSQPVSQSLKERQRQVRADAILDAARELLEEQGYAAMSMDDLASRVGISKATLYQHFASKDELAMQVIRRGMQRGLEEMAADDPALPALTRLERTLKRGIRRRATLWTTRITLPASVMRHPLYCEQRARMMEAISSLVEEAKAQGDIRADLGTPLIVHALQSLFRADYESLMTSNRLTLDQISEQLVAIVLQGIQIKEKL
ncbi:MAG: TetR/AcrR family transcriptional regulator [Anaerolineae bacterium]|nr:TetR/AcrR family transcriptional regulator [Anaerolineae bacterium]